jgi:hypothetical protein
MWPKRQRRLRKVRHCSKEIITDSWVTSRQIWLEETGQVHKFNEVQSVSAIHDGADAILTTSLRYLLSIWTRYISDDMHPRIDLPIFTSPEQNLRAFFFTTTVLNVYMQLIASTYHLTFITNSIYLVMHCNLATFNHGQFHHTQDWDFVHSPTPINRATFIIPDKTASPCNRYAIALRRQPMW